MKLNQKVLATATLLTTLAAGAGETKVGGQIWGQYKADMGTTKSYEAGIARARIWAKTDLTADWKGNLTLDSSTTADTSLTYANIKGHIGEGWFGMGLLDNADVAKLDKFAGNKWTGWGTLTQSMLGSASFTGANYVMPVGDKMDFNVALINATDTSTFAYSAGLGINVMEGLGINAFYKHDAALLSAKANTMGASLTFKHEMFELLGEFVSQKVTVGTLDTSMAAYGGSVNVMPQEKLGVYANFSTGDAAHKLAHGTTYAFGPTYKIESGLNGGLFYSSTSTTVTGSTASKILTARLAMDF